jgi:hypothetical protein
MVFWLNPTHLNLKLSTSQLIRVHLEKNVDPFCLYQMGWIKSKNISRC